jgi:hypothetical protein
VRHHLHLKVFQDEVVSPVLQQLLLEMLRWMEVLAWRIPALTFALLHTTRINQYS